MVLPERNTAGGMTGAARQAREMLDAFASVGTRAFDLTLTDAAGKAGSAATAPWASCGLPCPRFSKPPPSGGIT